MFHLKTNSLCSSASFPGKAIFFVVLLVPDQTRRLGDVCSFCSSELLEIWRMRRPGDGASAIKKGTDAVFLD